MKHWVVKFSSLGDFGPLHVWDTLESLKDHNMVYGVLQVGSVGMAVLNPRRSREDAELFLAGQHTGVETNLESRLLRQKVSIEDCKEFLRVLHPELIDCEETHGVNLVGTPVRFQFPAGLMELFITPQESLVVFTNNTNTCEAHVLYLKNDHKWVEAGGTLGSAVDNNREGGEVCEEEQG